MNEQEQRQEQALMRQYIQARIIAKAWKDEAYKQKLLTNPKIVIGREFDMEFSEEVNVQILEEDSSSFYFILPMSPMKITEELSQYELEVIAGGGLIKKATGLERTGRKFYDKRLSGLSRLGLDMYRYINS